MNNLRFQVLLTPDNIIAYAASIHSPLQSIGDTWMAPATMPVTFWQIKDVPWLRKEETLLHGAQRFTYQTPLLAGMKLDCELSLLKAEPKNGSRGALTVYTHSLVCYHQGRLLAVAETVLLGIGSGGRS